MYFVGDMELPANPNIGGLHCRKIFIRNHLNEASKTPKPKSPVYCGGEGLLLFSDTLQPHSPELVPLYTLEYYLIC